MKSFRFKSKVNVVEMRVGTRGPAGEQGPPGTGLTILGTVANEAALPADAEVGDGYLIDGELWVWQASEEWLNVGQIQGPPGDDGTDGSNGADGTDGREIELQTTATHVQWRYVGDTAWTDLVALSVITGPAGQDGDDGAPGIDGSDGAPGIDGADGKEVELQTSATHIQWRYAGEATWIDLVALSAITGADGIDGTDGADGADGTDGLGYQLTLTGNLTLSTQPIPSDVILTGTLAGTAFLVGSRVRGIATTDINAWFEGVITNDASGDVTIACDTHSSSTTTYSQWQISIAGIVGQNGANGTDGSNGSDGVDGANGVGVPTGGTTGQVLAKSSSTDYATEWVDQTATGDFLPLAGGTMDTDAEIAFDNLARIRQTPNDYGLDLVCSIDYVHRWKNGSLYIMDQSNGIRSVQYGLTNVPTAFYDVTEGYLVGSRYIKDDGTSYVCTDNTEGDAVWEEEVVATPAGTDTQVQFNDAGVFGGDAGLTYNKTTDTLTGVNQTFTGLSTLAHIHGNIAGSLYVHVKNASGVIIAKGTPVYATGSVGSSGEVEVAAADYTNSAKMPAIGIIDAELIANAQGNAVVVGEVMGLATNSYSINQELFVGTAGLLGVLPTTGEAQSIAVVSRVHASTGIIVVNAQARLNAALRALANNVGSGLTALNASNVTSGSLAIANGGTGQTSQTAAFDALAPTTTKGDIIVNNGTDNVRVPVGATNGHVLTVDSAEATGVKWAAGGGGGGLTNITETLVTSAPNATVNAEQLAVTSGTTNVNLVLTPRGTGGFMLGAPPDSGTTGGNIIGVRAVDLQLSHGLNTRVASGENAFAAGTSNTASGISATALGTTNTSTATASVAMGDSNNATANQSLAVGFSNTASGLTSVALGRTNNATGSRSVAIGISNTASATASVAIGEEANSSAANAMATGLRSGANRLGMWAHASGQFAANGDAQAVKFVVRNKTTTNSAVTLFLDGSSTRLTVPSGRILHLQVTLLGSKSDGTAAASYMRQVTIKNVAATTSLVGTVNTIGTDETAGTSIAITADDTNDALQIAVTGITSETWRWVAMVEGVEMAYGT